MEWIQSFCFMRIRPPAIPPLWTRPFWFISIRPPVIPPLWTRPFCFISIRPPVIPPLWTRPFWFISIRPPVIPPLWTQSSCFIQEMPSAIQPSWTCPYTHRHWALVAWQASSAVSPWVGYAPTTLGPNLYIQNIGLLASRRCILIKFFNFQIESIIMNH